MGVDQVIDACKIGRDAIDRMPKLSRPSNVSFISLRGDTKFFRKVIGQSLCLAEIDIEKCNVRTGSCQFFTDCLSDTAGSSCYNACSMFQFHERHFTTAM